MPLIRLTWIVALAAVVAIIALSAATLIPAAGTNVTAVNWSNPSGFCLTSRVAQGFKGESGQNTTLILSVPSSSKLEGCFVQGVTVDTPGFTVVNSNAPGMVGTWEPLDVTVKNPQGDYSGPLNITVNVVAVHGATPAPQLAMASSNFQVNRTAGTLFVVYLNIGSSAVSVNQVSFDGTSAVSSNTQLNSTCTNVASEDTCTVTLRFGPGLLPTPTGGSGHQLSLVTSSGALSYTVTAGELWKAIWASEA